MGCDIHSAAIDANGMPVEGGKWSDGADANPDMEWMTGEGEPFGWRSYAVFGFLAGVRNYSGVVPISLPRGLPVDIKVPHGEDFEYWLGDHSHSWLSVAELEAFDYDALVEDRRYTGQRALLWGGAITSGPCTAEPGNGKMMTWREFLGDSFFEDVAELRRIGADRVAFGFDS